VAACTLGSRRREELWSDPGVAGHGLPHFRRRPSPLQRARLRESGEALLHRIRGDCSALRNVGDGESACRRDSVGGACRPHRVTIHLSGLPGDCSLRSRTGRPCPTLGLAPGGVCLATPVARGTGALLPHRFTLTCALGAIGGLFSVALSCGSPRLAVNQRPALRSPDLPRSGHRPGAGPRPPGRLTVPRILPPGPPRGKIHRCHLATDRRTRGCHNRVETSSR
jgi:hypothetical protein